MELPSEEKVKMDRSSSGEEIDLLNVLMLIFRNKVKVIVSGLILTAIGSAFLLLRPEIYRSEAVFIVTGKDKSNPLEQWSMLASQFGFKMTENSDPLLSILDRVLTSERFYKGFLSLAVNPEYPEDSSLVRLFKVEKIPTEKQAKALAGKIMRSMKFVTNKDNSYSIIVKTHSSSLSHFLANEIAANLNRFFLERAQTEMNRKLTFLRGELALNKREVDSLAGRLRVFLEANKDITSPQLAFRYKEMNQELSMATEKYMLTMKAQQSLKIAASQSEYFFESVSPAEESGPMPLQRKLKLLAGIFAGSLFVSAVGVLFFGWFLKIARPGPDPS